MARGRISTKQEMRTKVERTVGRAQAASHRRQSEPEEEGKRKSDDEGEETEKAKEKERKESVYKRAAAVVF